MSTKAQKASLVLPMLAAFAGFFGWTIGDAAVRYLQDYSPFQIAFDTALGSLIIVLLLSPWTGGIKKSFQTPKQKLQALRGLILSCSNVCSVFAFWYLEMPIAYAIIFLAPFLGKLTSVILNKEYIKPKLWAITAAGFIGVLIVLRPGIVPMNIGTLAALAVAFFFSIGFVLGRYIGAENQTLFAQAFHTRFGLLFISGIAVLIVGHEPLDAEGFLLMALISCFAAFGSFVVSWAFTNAPTAYIAPIHYSQIIFGILWGIFLFDEYPDIWTYVGSALIVIAGLALSYFGRQRGLKNLAKKVV